MSITVKSLMGCSGELQLEEFMNATDGKMYELLTSINRTEVLYEDSFSSLETLLPGASDQ